MTARKHFKRRVRERALRTGESYSAALRHLRHPVPEEQPDMQWQRVEKTDFGYAVQVPHGWVERQPDLRNSPWETARFVDPADRRHSIIVFRSPLGAGRDAGYMAERAQTSLAASGFAALEIGDAEVGGLAAKRLDCEKRDAGRVWAVREYFVVEDGVGFCLGCGSSVPDEDEPLFESIARSFEIMTV
jgi:hypothetical protein